MLKTLQNFGIGRAAAVLGLAAGAAAILAAIMMRLGGEPMSLLYSNIDLKEAGQITAALDQAGVKYEVKGDGSTIMVARDKVASSRLLLSGKGLPTSGSVGYEIFDSAPVVGQTDFVQNLNRQRALEGELARTIRSIQGVTAARVHLVLPKRQLFEDEQESPSASIMVAIAGRPLTGEQIRAIRNLAAGAVPNLRADRVTIVDEAGELLAGGDDGAGNGVGGASGQRAEIEEKLRKTVKDLVEGVVGPGKARVTVSADVDMARVTLQEEKFDPDGQVVRSTQTSTQNSNETRPSPAGAVSVAQNVPGAQQNTVALNANSNSGEQQETTNYEISRTTRTEVQEPGRVKRLSVAVAVDGVTGPAGKDGRPGPYAPRSAQEMQRIEQLVRSAVGYDAERGDQISVVNVRFDRAALADAEGVSAATPFSFDKNDIMRAGELGVLLIVAVLLILFVAGPLIKGGPKGASPLLALASSGAGAGAGRVTPVAIEQAGGTSLILPAPNDMEQRIDIAKIEGQVKTSSVAKVAEFVEKHPEESVSILRSWLHES